MLHEYLRDTLELSYNECKSCKNRTQFTCICGFCYSCHWKNEKLEKIQFKPLANANSGLFNSYPQPATATTAQTEEQSRHQPTQQQQQLTKVVDVFGRETEPICSYHTCHHKFSLHRHSTRTCKCHHPRNHVVGVSVL
jgi:hypothetical protein